VSAVVLRGDAAHLPLPDGSVDLIVTSPPYWGLRSYTDGGEHYGGQIGSEETPQEWLEAVWRCTAEWMRVLKPTGSIFVNCGDKYAAGHGGRSTEGDGDNIRVCRNRPAAEHWAGTDSHPSASRAVIVPGFRPKTLMMLPQRYAIGCMDRLGLILRAEIIWEKPNGLPESVTDRVRRAHEQIWHFTKQPRYFAAMDEVREPHTGGTHGRRADGQHSPKEQATITSGFRRGYFPENRENPLGKLPGSVWDIPSQPLIVPPYLGVDHFAAFPLELPRRIILGWSPSGICLECGEGRRPVADAVALDMGRPQARRAQQLADRAGLTEAHLQALLSVGISDTGRGAATQNGTGRNTAEVYALADAARIALGGYAREYLLRRPTSFGYACACCPHTDHPGSGKPTQRRDYNPSQDSGPQGTYGRKQAGEYERVGPWREYHLEGWTPPPTRPAVVVDPFAGTGTSILVADALGRTGIGIDRSMDYCRLARWRTTDPAERARALGVPKPPPVPEGQASLFDHLEAS
jgi:DNA modification methylase